MQQKAMGDSGLVCSALGFGTWELSTTQYGAIDVAQASNAVAMAIDHGITLFDTAEVYGPYHSEELLGKALGNRRNEIVLVTKVGFTYDDAGKITGRSSKHDYILERTEGCLRRLNTDCIDLMLIHWPDHATPIAEPIGALEALKAAGKIRHYGVSNFTVAMMEECEQAGHLTANQVGYHPYDRRMQAEVLPYCLAHQIGFMAYGTLAFGLLTGTFTPKTTFVDWDWRSKGSAFGLPLFEREHFLKELRVTQRLKEFAADYGRTVAQLAIAWVTGHPAVSVALVGMRNEQELVENVQATEWQLSDADRAAIDQIFVEEAVPTYVDAAQAV
ncbi:MAG: aldo/keto reductase [Caldilineaceae bacterium]|nr:aldo/keto reductase [Caldilineaceae bacterium]